MNRKTTIGRRNAVSTMECPNLHVEHVRITSEKVAPAPVVLNSNMEFMAILFPNRNLIVDCGTLVVTVAVSLGFGMSGNFLEYCTAASSATR